MKYSILQFEDGQLDDEAGTHLALCLFLNSLKDTDDLTFAPLAQTERGGQWKNHFGARPVSREWRKHAI